MISWLRSEYLELWFGLNFGHNKFGTTIFSDQITLQESARNMRPELHINVRSRPALASSLRDVLTSQGESRNYQNNLSALPIK